MDTMERIASFSVDHSLLVPGLYLSRRDREITSLDLRFKKPNTGDLLTNSEMHSAEHVVATMLRNDALKDGVIYFGPFGCQTGFFFLYDTRIISDEQAIDLLKKVFSTAAVYDGPMPGGSVTECGNFANLDMEASRRICAYYADLIKDWTVNDWFYPEA